MPTINTKDLTGGALDWAVALCEHQSGRYTSDSQNYKLPIFSMDPEWFADGEGPFVFGAGDGRWQPSMKAGVNTKWQQRGPSCGRFAPSTDWKWGGPIIERAKLELMHRNRWQDGLPVWQVGGNYDLEGSGAGASFDGNCMEHESLLVAAMRCYVKCMLGDTIEIPEVLL